ncbi:hypothetical protein APLC1_6503 [Limnospira platensis C1]|nr:hypothetical protein APLC1_6503 [Arthrospira platensis C1]
MSMDEIIIGSATLSIGWLLPKSNMVFCLNKYLDLVGVYGG